MKKTLSLILAALMLASSFASCGKTDPVRLYATGNHKEGRFFLYLSDYRPS